MNFDECEAALKLGALVPLVRFLSGDDRPGNNNVRHWFLYINVTYIFYLPVHVFLSNTTHVLIYLSQEYARVVVTVLWRFLSVVFRIKSSKCFLNVLFMRGLLPGS